ncbi:MAG: hypothetical protein MUE62_08535 [Burkholderiaceae bacterium]|jgi:hypothetical protein|nr:hypothetical protein [Burkholderiaceae bacterium]
MRTRAASAGPQPQADGVGASRGGAATSWLALAASTSTLVCCALPALLVTVGAGASLATMVSVFPQIVWLSEHKAAVFAGASVLLGAGGWAQWRLRTAPCPVDPALRDLCLRTRQRSSRLYVASLALFGIGGWFAFVQPLLAG